MARRGQTRRATSPIPEDPFCTVLPGFVRARDGNSFPNVLPGVRLIPSEILDMLTNHLSLGKYFASSTSLTGFLGPFDHEPTAEELPSGNSYGIWQREKERIIYKGRKRVVDKFVGKLTILPRQRSARPISPSKVPFLRVVSGELDEEETRNLVAGKYYARSTTRMLGPFDNMPTRDMLPIGGFYFILQEMGRDNTGLVYRMVTQLDC